MAGGILEGGSGSVGPVGVGGTGESEDTVFGDFGDVEGGSGGFVDVFGGEGEAAGCALEGFIGEVGGAVCVFADGMGAGSGSSALTSRASLITLRVLVKAMRTGPSVISLVSLSSSLIYFSRLV